MRRKRIKLEGMSHYHVMNKIVDSGVRLDDAEMERFYRTMRKVEAYSGVQILTYALMRNHFHILVAVPRRRELSDEEVIERMRLLYSAADMKRFEKNWERWREQGLDDLVAEALDRQRLRMYDVSQFMKTLKQRISMSYNYRHKRLGYLWNDRFQSVLVEGREEALATMAAYIDLNPVRAELVKDPKDYHFSGYGEAMGGSPRAIEGLACVLGNSFGGAVSGDVLARYRVHLYQSGVVRKSAATGETVRTGLDRVAVQKVLEANGKVPMSTALYCRVRYLTDGLVIGSSVWIEDLAREHSDLAKSLGGLTARVFGQIENCTLCSGKRLHRAPITLPQLE